MPRLLTPQRWTSQPQYPVGVDWSNPVTQGLEFLTDSELVDLFTKVRPAVSGATPPAKAISNMGRGYSFSGSGLATGYLDYGALVASNLMTAAGTMAFLINIANVSVAQCIAGKSDNNNDGGWIIECNANGSLRSKIISVNINAIIDSAAGSLVSNKWHFIALTFDGVFPVSSGLNLWIDGKNTTSVGDVGVGVTSSNAADPFYIGTQTYQDSRTRDLNGIVSFGAGWRRCLSASEIVSLSANPWQLFSPRLV
jgi:hypothetical protein